MPRQHPELSETTARILQALNVITEPAPAHKIARLSGTSPIRTNQQLNRLEKDGVAKRDEQGRWSLA